MSQFKSWDAGTFRAAIREDSTAMCATLFGVIVALAHRPIDFHQSRR
jgi:hypothetical protein